MIKKKYILAIATVAAIFAVTGCGGNPTKNPDSNTSGNTTSATVSNEVVENNSQQSSVKETFPGETANADTSTKAEETSAAANTGNDANKDTSATNTNTNTAPATQPVTKPAPTVTNPTETSPKPTQAPAPTKPQAYVGLAGKTAAEYGVGLNDNDLKKVDDIIKTINPSGTRVQKAKAVLDWMVGFGYVMPDNVSTGNSASSLLNEGVAKCNGYADLYMVFMTEIGVPCKTVRGTCGVTQFFPHKWVTVQLDDGAWYFIDVNNSDVYHEGYGAKYPNGDNISYDNFLMTKHEASTFLHPEGDVWPENSGTNESYRLDIITVYNEHINKTALELSTANFKAKGFNTFPIHTKADIDAVFTPSNTWTHGNVALLVTDYELMEHLHNKISDHSIASLYTRDMPREPFEYTAENVRYWAFNFPTLQVVTLTKPQ